MLNLVKIEQNYLLKVSTFYEVAKTKNNLYRTTDSGSDTLDQKYDIEIIDKVDQDSLYAI